MQSPKELRDENTSLRKQIKNFVQRRESLYREITSLNMRIDGKAQYIKDNIELIKELKVVQTKRYDWAEGAEADVKV